MKRLEYASIQLRLSSPLFPHTTPQLLRSPHTYDDMLDFYVHSIEVGYNITGFITTLLLEAINFFPLGNRNHKS